MSFQEILYIIIAVGIVVITVTVVWVSSELIALLRSLRRTATDAEAASKEMKDKIILVSEALDRLGTVSSRMLGLAEAAEKEIGPKREKVASSIGLIVGAADFSRGGKVGETEVIEQVEKEEKKPPEQKLPEKKEVKKAEKPEPEEKEKKSEKNEVGDLGKGIKRVKEVKSKPMEKAEPKEERVEKEKAPAPEGVGVPTKNVGKDEKETVPTESRGSSAESAGKIEVVDNNPKKAEKVPVENKTDDKEVGTAEVDKKDDPPKVEEKDTAGMTVKSGTEAESEDNR